MIPKLVHHSLLPAACKCLDDSIILLMMSSCTTFSVKVKDKAAIVIEACRRPTRIVLESLHERNISNGFEAEIKIAVRSESLNIVRYLLVKYQQPQLNAIHELELYYSGLIAARSSDTSILAEVIAYSPRLYKYKQLLSYTYA